MFTVRGNNVFPTAIEAVIRRFPEVAEFRVTVTSGAGLASVAVEVEPVPSAAASGDLLAKRVASALQESLSFRADVAVVPAGALPRFEMKARRFVRKSNSPKS
jgi:phenylacetate-CoA ligase